MPGDCFDDMLAAALEGRREADLYRQRRAIKLLDAARVEIDGRRYVNFASNNYLGLTHHPDVVEAAARATRDNGAGSGASGLITGYTPLHAAAEAGLATWKGTESAVILPSGYQANHAAVQAIAGAAEAAGRGVRFLVDRLVHASLIDAVRATCSRWRAFPHTDIEKLRKLLNSADADEVQVVLTESIFSMDGDAADLPALARLRKERPFVLLVDEAHGSGVYGEGGSGWAAECGVAADVDLFVVTLSKALGGIGGAVCSSRRMCDAVVNFGRAYIYSTSVPPATLAGCQAAIEVMRKEPWRQRRVRKLAMRVRSRLSQAAWSVKAGDCPIVPLIVAEEKAAIESSERLRQEGMIVPAVRPPTVPRGTSRLRLTMCCEHSDQEIDRLIGCLSSAPAR